jgi:hypothetical protein
MAITTGRAFFMGSQEPAQALPAERARLQAAARPGQARRPAAEAPQEQAQPWAQALREEEARLPVAAAAVLPARLQASQAAARAAVCGSPSCSTHQRR